MLGVRLLLRSLLSGSRAGDVVGSALAGDSAGEGPDFSELTLSVVLFLPLKSTRSNECSSRSAALLSAPIIGRW